MLYESYRYIHTPDGGARDSTHKVSDVLENRYRSADDLGQRFIVYSGDIGYRVYPTLDAFLRHFAEMDDARRTFHEVIFDKPQKLKFDIDAPLDKIDEFITATGGVDAIEREATSANLEDAIIADCGTFDDPDIEAFLDMFGCENTEPAGDVRTDPSMSRNRTYTHILETIKHAIRNAFFITFGRDIPLEHEIVCESVAVGAPITKFSNHIIIDGFYVRSYAQAREFTRRVAQMIPKCYHMFLDLSVNKRIQNFRLVGCHKIDDNRTKRIISQHAARSSVVTNVTDCIQLPDILIDVAVAAVESSAMHPDDIDAVVAMCARDPDVSAHRYKFVRNGVFVFTRLRPSHCDFCGRTHDSDNTMFVNACVANGVVTAYKQCRKYITEHGKNGSHSVKIGEAVSGIIPTAQPTDFQPITDSPTAQLGWRDNAIQRAITSDSDMRTHATRFDLLPAALRHVYNEPALRPFELTSTLVVRAAMKMGKTKALTAYMGQYFSDGIRQPIIRFVSFRQTFSGNIKEKFSDFTLYSDVKGLLSCAKLIVQVESLYRLDIQEGTEPPDLLILDECESIFEQFDSGLLRGKFNDCFSKFKYLLKHSQHVVCLDANVSDRTFRILEIMRPRFTETVERGDQVVYHCNTHRNATKDVYSVCGNKVKWLALLYSSVDADERLAIPMSSLADAKVLMINLTKLYPRKVVRIYSSETSPGEKREHFADVNLYWSQIDVLIYTPTVSAGVSFERKHFAKVFGYFTDQSCPVETCQQMIGRIRDVADHDFYICLDASGNSLPTTISELQRALHERRDNLTRNADYTGLQSEYGPTGEIIYHASDYFHLWLENTRVRNMSRNSFIRRFIQVVSTTGATMRFLSDELFEDATGMPMFVEGVLNETIGCITADHNAIRESVRAESNMLIANAPDLDDEEAAEIQTLMAAQTATIEQRRSFDKYRLRLDYKYDGVIDAVFVAKYGDPKTRRKFKNVTRLYGRTTHEEALAIIHNEESAHHRYLMQLGEAGQHQDLHRRYSFDQHRYTLKLLKLLGWNNINDARFVHQDQIVRVLETDMTTYWSMLIAAYRELELPTPSLRKIQAARAEGPTVFAAHAKKMVNRLTSAMYGVTIGSRKIDPLMFILSKNALFSLDAEDARNRRVPLIIPA